MCPSDEDEEQLDEARGRRDTVTLYRPVGQAELDLIAATDWTAFPPRLPFQPIFYPVLNADYAAQIARDWNTKDKASGFVGYVLRFEVASSVAQRYDVQTVGASHHQELWVPQTSWTRSTAPSLVASKWSRSSRVRHPPDIAPRSKPGC